MTIHSIQHFSHLTENEIPYYIQSFQVVLIEFDVSKFCHKLILTTIAVNYLNIFCVVLVYSL